MKTAPIFIWSLLFLLALHAQEDPAVLNRQAQALFESQDFAQAYALLKPLQQQSLPDWQQMRLLYNLGTLQLAQKQPENAFKFFSKVDPSKLSLPRLARDFFLNEGIACLIQAKLSTSSLVEERLFLTRQSLRALENAQALACQIPTELCQDILAERWIQEGRLLLSSLQAQRQLDWLKQASIDQLAYFLIHSLQEVRLRIENASSLAPYASYFQRQLDSLFPLWQALQVQLTKDKLAALNQAATFFLDAMQELLIPDQTKALQALEAAILQLGALSFDSPTPFRRFLIDYEMALLQQQPTLLALSSLQKQIEKLEEAKALAHARSYLAKSLSARNNNQFIASHFFLLAGFNLALQVNPEISTSPIAILQQALEQARVALQLHLLYHLLPEAIQKEAPSFQLVQSAAKQIPQQAKEFIGAALQDQTQRFQQADAPGHACQQSPWDRVIPLFDRGYQSAWQVSEQMDASKMETEKLIAKQIQTIQDWQQALQLLLHPPQINQTENAQQEASAQERNETIRLVQEMYLEDQAEPEHAVQELHSW